MRPRGGASEDTGRRCNGQNRGDIEAEESSPKGQHHKNSKMNRYRLMLFFIALVVLLIMCFTLQAVPDAASFAEVRTFSTLAEITELSLSHVATHQRTEDEAARDAGVGAKLGIPLTAPEVKEQRMTVGIKGLSNVDLNGKYSLDAGQIIIGRETYWTSDEEYFLYYCQNPDVPDLLERWCVTRQINFHIVKNGGCRAIARTVRKSYDPHTIEGWEDYSQPNSQFLGPKQPDSIAESTGTNVVTLGNFLRPDYNSDFWERSDLKVNQHETYWCSTGEFFIYWCSADISEIYSNRWVVAPSSMFVQIQQGECTGQVKAPRDRDILDRSLVHGWEEILEDETWMSFTGRCGVIKISKLNEPMTSLENRAHAHHSDQHHSQHGQGHACVRCGSKIHGPVPTSLIAHTYHHCAWKFQPRKYLEDVVDESKYDVHVAKSLCIDLGVDCTGVTCQGGDHSCGLRSGDVLTQSIDAFEWTYVKACPKKLESGCDDLGPSPEQRGMDAGMGDTGEMKNGVIVVIGGENVKALKECLTSLSKLIDVHMFKIMVALSPSSLAEDVDVIINDVESSSGLQIQRWQAPPRDKIPLNPWMETSEAKHAHHYNATFEKVFVDLSIEYAVFVDEDLIFSPDFLSMFRSTAWLLRRDPSLWCISAWNENAFRVSDACRLMRTSTFPGKAFLMRKNIWRFIRSYFPTIMTKGWQSQMKIVFRSFTKECIIPEVPRVHRPNRDGSADAIVVAQALMEYAAVPTTCLAYGDCAHFGNTTYLLDKKYEQVLHGVIRSHPRLRFNTARLIDGMDRLDPSTVHILPFAKQDYSHELAVLVGHRPGGDEFKSLPQELYADHFGIVYGRLSNLVPVILVDMRSTRKHLLPNERTSLSSYHKPFASKFGESCASACARSGGRCDWSQLEYFNSCRFLQSTFECKERGCVAGDGSALPAFVSNKSSPQDGQCLMTFNALLPGPDSCSLKSADLARLCACGYHEVTTTLKPEFHEWQLLFTTIYDPLVLAKRPEAETRMFIATNGLGSKQVKGHVARLGVNLNDQGWEHSRFDTQWNKGQDSARAATENIYYIHNHNVSYNPRRNDFIKVTGVYLEHFPKKIDSSDEDFEVRDLDSSYNECEALNDPQSKGDVLAGYYPIDLHEAALNRCTGVTCDHELKECTCRSGKSIKKSHTGEITFIHMPHFVMGQRLPMLSRALG